MIGYLRIFKKIFYLKPYTEAGSAIVEFAFVMPVLLILAFSSYNLMRMMEVDMLKKDLSRSLALSYLCSFKSTGATAICYQDAIDNIAAYEASKQVLNNQDANIKFYYSVHTYKLRDPDAMVRSIEKCDNDISPETSDHIWALKIDYIGGYTSANYTDARYDLDSVQTRANGIEKMKVGNLFNQPDTAYGRVILCLNGLITVAEVKFELKPFFNYGDATPQTFHEISYI